MEKTGWTQSSPLNLRIMLIKVRLFATLARYVPGTAAGETMEVTLPDKATVTDLLAKLAVPEGEVKAVYVNGRHRPCDWILAEGDEVGFFPPIGGG